MSSSGDPELPIQAHQPGVLLMHLLDQCNLSCRHCYADAGPGGSTHLPPELAIRSLNEVEQLGITTVYLSGGEPFLYPRLPEVLAAASHSKGVSVHVSTNGTLIGAKQAALLKECGVTAQVSIDGAEAFHDRFRGNNGAFRSANRGIEQLIAAEVPVAVVTTIFRENVGSLRQLCDWAANTGVEHISVQPLLRLGRGAQMYELRLSDEQLCDLFLQLSDLGHVFRARGLHFSLAYRTRQFLLEHPCAAYVCDGTRCHRKVDKEIKKLVVREDGTVLPEIPTLHSRYALGNLRDGTLVELVKHYLGEGYVQFQNLCRTVYEDVMPSWMCPIIPWDEIVSERSWQSDNKPARVQCSGSIT